MNELKERRLPTFGTVNEKRDRLKKHYGIDTTHDSSVGTPGQQSHHNVQLQSQNTQKKSNCREEIEKLKQQREERRARMDEVKRNRTERENNNKNLGIKADVDFQVLVEREQLKMQAPRPVSLFVFF